MGNSNVVGINSFAFADLQSLPLSVLTARLALIQAAIGARLVANQSTAEVVEEYTINGKTERRTSLDFLTMYEATIYRAIRIISIEPDGIGIAQARMGNRNTGRRGGFN